VESHESSRCGDALEIRLPKTEEAKTKAITAKID
jgi:hypothetical protein